MTRPASPKGRPCCTRGRSCILITTLGAVQSVEEVSLAAWFVGLGFIGPEAYFFATLLRAWITDRRAGIASERPRVR